MIDHLDGRQQAVLCPFTRRKALILPLLRKILDPRLTIVTYDGARSCANLTCSNFRTVQQFRVGPREFERTGQSAVRLSSFECEHARTSLAGWFGRCRKNGRMCKECSERSALQTKQCAGHAPLRRAGMHASTSSLFGCTLFDAWHTD